MTERFKKYLEEAFRVIPPTKAAMDYRKATLVTLRNTLKIVVSKV